MEFIVTTKDGETATLTPNELCELISAKIPKHKETSTAEVYKAFTWMLGEVLYRTSLEEFGWLAFLAGYYYRAFLERNDVEVVESKLPETSTEDPKEASDNNGPASFGSP